MQEKHVATGAVEQGVEDLRWNIGTILTEDTLISDATGDLHPGFAGDVAKDLIETGIIGRDEKFAGSVGNFCMNRRFL